MGSSFRFAVVAHGSTYALLEGSSAQMHRALFNRIMESPEENLGGDSIENKRARALKTCGDKGNEK